MGQKRTAIYIRVSSDEAKTEGYSPQTQEEKLREFINANDYELDEKHIYADLGYSGGTDKRPELRRLLEDAKNKEFDIILVYRQDRFFRNLRLLINTVGDLRELGIEFKSLTEPFDTTTPTGRAMFGNAGIFAEWQREIGLEARNEGMIKAMKEGKWLGASPYGYKFNRETHKLEIDEEEAEIVRMMFEWLVSEKLSKYKIQERLNERKIPTKWDRLGKKKRVNEQGWWNVGTVERILKYEIYTGTFYYRKYKYGRDASKELRPKEEWIEIKVLPAIISKELYEKAQEQLKANQRFSPRRTEMVYAFQHKLYCGLDGFPYHCFYRVPQKPQWKGAKVYYCGGKVKHSHSKLCSSKYIAESRLLAPVWENLRELLTNPETVMENHQEYHDRASKRKLIEEEMERVSKALLACQRKKEKVLNLYLEEYIDEPIYKSKLDELKKEELKYQKETERLSQFLLTEQEKENRVLSIRELHKGLQSGFNNDTYEFRCYLIKNLVERIKVTGDSLEIEYNLPVKEAIQELGGIVPASEFYHHTPRMD